MKKVKSMNLIDFLRRLGFLGYIFHTLDYCLQRELKDCNSVLDLGCGPASPLRHCSNIKYSVGVDAFEPYLERSKTANIHKECLNQRIEDLNFPKDSFDAVIMIEVIEHLSEAEALKLLEKAEIWAKKKVIFSTPNGFVKQPSVDGNIFQQHLSGWDYQKLSDLGYVCRGLSGIKALRNNAYSGTIAEGDILNTIRFKPRVLWFMAAALTQLYAYWNPGSAYGLFCVKSKVYTR